MRSRTYGVRKLVVAGSLAALATAGVVCSAGAQAATEPGVTAKTVKIGFIFSETGVAGSSFKNAGKAFQARIDDQNAKGGVNGRKIQAEVVDDASGSGNLTAAQDLVQNRNVFMVVNNSSFAFLSYRFLQNAGVPVIGGGFDGTYYGQKGNENVISALGNAAPISGLTYDYTTTVMKQKKATKVAAIAYGVSASSVANAKTVQGYAVPQAGLKDVYTNTAVDFGTTDVGPLALGIKNAGADATYLPIDGNTSLALVTALQQNGVQMKANILANGYGQEILDSPASASLTGNTLFWQGYKPVELKTKETKQFQADLKKYANYTGVPDYGMYTGYLTADLAVQGLLHAGQTPTRQGFIDGIHNMGTWDGAGITCQPLDVSLKNYGKYGPTACAYFEYVKGGKWVIYNNAKPIKGKLVGDPALVSANAAGELSAATTVPATTAAP